MAKFGIGQAVRRVEDQRFLLGQGRYVDDISLPGQCHGVTVLSPHAHARIRRIDVSKAKAAPGVLCVLTGADAVAEKLGSLTAHLMPEDFGAPKGHRTFQPVLNAGQGALRRRPRRVRGGRDAGPGARCRRAGGGRLRAAAGGGRARGRRQGRRHQGVGRLPAGQCRLPADVRQQGRDRRRVRQGQARGQAARREQPALAGRAWSRASPSATTTPPTTTYTLYTASQNPHGVRMEMSHIFHVPENQHPGGLARCRRWLRAQGRPVSRRRAGAVGVAPHRAGR